MLSLYLNEKSFSGQVYSSEWFDMAGEFFDCIKILNDCNSPNLSVYYTSALYSAFVTADHHTFSAMIAKESDMKSLLRIYLRKIINWDSSPLTESDHSYLYQGDDYFFTSISEAYENPSSETGIVNFPNSPFEEHTIQVLKDKKSRDIHSFSLSDHLGQFLIAQGVAQHKYDERCTRSPRDYETILADTSLFEPTNEPLQNGRKVYKRIAYDELWYVDNAHYGTNAHIEVFNSKTRKMKAVSRVNEINIFRQLKADEERRTI